MSRRLSLFCCCRRKTRLFFAAGCRISLHSNDSTSRPHLTALISTKKLQNIVQSTDGIVAPVGNPFDTYFGEPSPTETVSTEPPSPCAEISLQ
jgi:hypothetical protein